MKYQHLLRAKIIEMIKELINQDKLVYVKNKFLKMRMSVLRIGVIGPTEKEIMPFINKITEKKLIEHAMLKFYSGIYRGVEVVSVFCGVCKVNAAIATQLLISKFEVTHIILTGVAGALNKQLKIGDLATDLFSDYFLNIIS